MHTGDNLPHETLDLRSSGQSNSTRTPVKAGGIPIPSRVDIALIWLFQLENQL